MENFNLTELIKKAITTKKELRIKLKPSSTFTSQEIRFCPFIFGADLLNFKFIWGYLPDYEIFYSLPVREIDHAAPLSNLFSSYPSPTYSKASGEKHYCVLEEVLN